MGNAKLVQDVIWALSREERMMTLHQGAKDKAELRSLRALLGKYAKKAGMVLKTKRVGDDLRIWRVE
jgi:hypothetical protein